MGPLCERHYHTARTHPHPNQNYVPKHPKIPQLSQRKQLTVKSANNHRISHPPKTTRNLSKKEKTATHVSLATVDAQTGNACFEKGVEKEIQDVY